MTKYIKKEDAMTVIEAACKLTSALLESIAQFCVVMDNIKVREIEDD